jgi:hypothetical protein
MIVQLVEAFALVNNLECETSLCTEVLTLEVGPLARCPQKAVSPISTVHEE